MQCFGENESQTGPFCLSTAFFGMLAGGNLNEFLVGEIIRNLPDGVSEIMTHPGMDAESLEKTFPGSIIGKMSFRLFFLKK